jgi:hypothetical protein
MVQVNAKIEINLMFEPNSENSTWYQSIGLEEAIAQASSKPTSLFCRTLRPS